MQIYLDYSATTPTRPEAIAKIQQVLESSWGNPSSLHQWGQRSALALEEARFQVADLIAASPESVVFTGGGTESDNLALLGVTQRYDTPQHIIISAVEHSAIEKPASALERQGWQVTRLSVNREGLVSPRELQQALQPDTVMISVIYGQSEVGTLQPIQVLGQIAREAGILFHTDAVQVAGRMPLDVKTLNVDLLSLSSHKLYGPQGVGALYIRPGLELEPVIRGGGQEHQQRSGTQAVAAIAGFGVAATLAQQELESEAARLNLLRDRLIRQMTALPGVKLTGHPTQRLPHHTSFAITRPTDIQPTEENMTVSPNLQASFSGRNLVYQMNLAGIGISAGSACNSGQSVPSRVLKAMGYGDREALSAVRLTLGKATTIADVDWAALAFKQILSRL